NHHFLFWTRNRTSSWRKLWFFPSWWFDAIMGLLSFPLRGTPPQGHAIAPGTPARTGGNSGWARRSVRGASTSIVPGPVAGPGGLFPGAAARARWAERPDRK